VRVGPQDREGEFTGKHDHEAHRGTVNEARCRLSTGIPRR
jgi:hypothetical protein